MSGTPGEPAVRLRRAGVAFGIAHADRRALQGDVRVDGSRFWAVRAVDLEVRRGEVLGLIGANGAGKTTLLRLIAGILHPDEGAVERRGSASSLIALNAGLKPNLTGRQNLVLGLALHGVTGTRAAALEEPIAELAGLGRFLDVPVATYSSGMKARLGFAIAVHAPHDVLVLDEVLAVGDRDFRERSVAVVEELVTGGATVVIAAHEVGRLARLSDRIVRLEHGRVVDRGEATAVVSRYVPPRPADPLVSVIVAARDEEAHLHRCLTSLQLQTYRPLEVVVCDDGSTDATAAVASAFPEVRWVSIPPPGRGAGAARNRAVRASSGELCVLVDADLICDARFVEDLVRPMIQDPAVPGTFTTNILVANAHQRWAYAHQVGRGLSPHTHFRPDHPDRWEIFRAFRRKDFEAVGGFGEIGYGEDVTLGARLGALAHRVDGAVCWHFEPDHLRDIARTARWYGRGATIRPSTARAARPHRSMVRAVRMAVRHRRASVGVYRLVWDWQVRRGWRTRERGGVQR